MRKHGSFAFAGAVAALLAAGPLVFSQQRATPAPVPAAPAVHAPTPAARLTSPAASPVQVTSKDLTRGQMEQFLMNARIVNTRPADKGTTHDAERATLSDGRITHDAHIQTIDLYMPEARINGKIEKNFRDSYKFNIAAYQLDKMMDLGVVPVCVYRVVNGKPASVDWWVDNVLFDEEGRRAQKAEAPDQQSWVNQLNIVRDFDQLINNEDRNQGNLLIDRDWKLWAIDESRSFRPDFTLRDPSVLRRISGKMLTAMKNLNQRNLEANLLPFVTKEDIQALLARRDLLVKFFDNEITQKGQDAVILDLPRTTPEVTIP